MTREEAFLFLGNKPIEAGILETVLLLNCLGLTTNQSCEGHTDWGVPYPWVHVFGEHMARVIELVSEFNAEANGDLDVWEMGDEELLDVRIMTRLGEDAGLETARKEMERFTAFLRGLL